MQDEDFKREVLACMKKNTEAIEKVAEDTRGLVEMWKAAEGGIKIAKIVGNVMKWITIVGTPIIAFAYWIKTGNWK